MTRKTRPDRALALAGMLAVVAIGVGVGLQAEEPSGGGPDRPKVDISLDNATRLPPDFPREDVEACGKSLNAWDEGPTRVFMFRGEFRLDANFRRLSADNAVIWVTPERVGEQVVKRFVIFLEGSARAVELGGTATTDSRLIVSLETAGRFYTYADATAEESAGDSELYQRAASLRREPGPSPLHDLAAGRPAGGQQPETKAARPGEPIIFRAEKTTVEVNGPERLIILDGEVVVTQASGPQVGSGQRLAIRADRAVLFAQETASASRPLAGDLAMEVTGAYLEGDVVMTAGERTIESPRLYYDFENHRALILDAIMTAPHQTRNVPIIVRADQIRMLSRDELKATGALITTSEMNTPQYAFGAREIYLRNETTDDGRMRLYYEARGETTTIRGVPVAWWPGSEGEAGQEETALRRLKTGNDSEFGPYIIAQWHLARLLGFRQPQGLKTFLETDFFGKRGPAAGVKAKYLRDDFFGFLDSFIVWDHATTKDRVSKADFESDEQVGLSTDSSEDEGVVRGRILGRGRQYFGDGWETTAEVSYMSDRNFLREWFKKEYDIGKEQETLLYAKKTWGVSAFTILAKVRINDFLNQTEKLPEVKYYRLGQPLWNDRLVYFSENSAAALNYATDEARTRGRDLIPVEESANGEDEAVMSDSTALAPAIRESSGWGGRIDTRHEIQLPLSYHGLFQIVPYAVLRATSWSRTMTTRTRDVERTGEVSDENTDEDRDKGENDGTVVELPADEIQGPGGGKTRIFGDAGVKFATWFARTFNGVESRFWDVHRLRHLVKPELTLHLANASVERDELYPYDAGVESITGSSAANFSLRQILQTKRGGPGAWRSVDWMILDIEATVFSDDDVASNFEPEFTRPGAAVARLPRGEFFDYRPENSLAHNTLNLFYQWRVSDSLALLADANIGEDGLDRTAVGVAVQRTPRWSMYFGHRTIKMLDSSELLFRSNYQINRKYSTQASLAYDLQNNRFSSLQLMLVRKFQRWYVGLTFEVSESGDQTTAGVTVWPEGAPEMTVKTGQISAFGSTSNSKEEE